jgi:sulfopyruvate decarboxylase subunit beta
MMVRTDALREIARYRGDALVIAVYSSAFEWLEISPHPLNFLAVGAMGQAATNGLGFAVGLPDKQVIVFDGDGSLLMNLGTLVTIADVGPDNLTHFVAQNGCYEANGEHPIPGRERVSFAGFARSAGYRTVAEFRDIAHMTRDLGTFMASPGPRFATLFVEPGVKPELDYALVHGEPARKRFAAALAEDMTRAAASAAHLKDRS